MAIDDLLDEHEQSERVRIWIRNNAAGMIGGVALGLAAIYGWFWWQDKQAAEHQKTSDQYQTIVADLKAGKLKEAQAASAALKGSSYAALAALDLAKAQADGGKRDDAIATLRGVSAEDAAIQAVATQRLARLLIDAGKSEEALTLLQNVDEPLAHDVRGDALYALGRKEQAQKAYEKALTGLDEGSQLRPLIELKLTQAGGTPKKPDSAS
ncbi:MAG: tetratricopeptide repeat protein [Bauldia sp.]|nr:MAG: tetratricopeptide repeat protein [Bauldia sp.]